MYTESQSGSIDVERKIDSIKHYNMPVLFKATRFGS